MCHQWLTDGVNMLRSGRSRRCEPYAAACVRCGAPLPGTCAQRQCRPPAFDWTPTIFRDQAPLDALIKKLKFNGDLHITRSIGDDDGESLDGMVDLIVPVPLHVQRLRQRHFNWALDLAFPSRGGWGSRYIGGAWYAPAPPTLRIRRPKCEPTMSKAHLPFCRASRHSVSPSWMTR